MIARNNDVIFSSVKEVIKIKFYYSELKIYVMLLLKDVTLKYSFHTWLILFSWHLVTQG